MRDLFVGLMSGTSADGIDAVLVDFVEGKPTLIETHFQKFELPLREKIQAFSKPRHDEITQLGYLDVTLGKAFADSTLNLLKKAGVETKDIRGIGSHGQTLRHQPEQRFTLQVGDPNIIASETGITTVADFRRRDMACGGQGAPLVPAFHHIYFGSDTEDRCIVNLGGIANVTFLPKSSTDISGFDTGPGNTLLDAWINRHLHTSFDENGHWAQTGQVDKTLLANLLKDTYFTLTAPKSTGPEYFNLSWLESFFCETLSPVDVQATLVDLTCISLLEAINKRFDRCKIIICGGGAKNNFLLSRMSELTSKHSVQTSTELGLDPDWVEATAFAWLAKQTLEGKPSNLKEVTGAKNATVLGGIYISN